MDGSHRATDLEMEEYRRYGRQMILPELGKQSQIHLKSSAVLIVGVGGLGCPAVAYLAGAGVGRIGLVDMDTVSLSNCHRQILYSASEAGTLKVDAAAAFIERLNPLVHVDTYRQRLSTDNVQAIFETYQLVLDCSDNQATRYLISDACVLLGIPLVSGSALKTEGQLAVYNHKGGPCYRCLFPKPAPAETIASCSEAGILGPVVGVIGIMQALEAIKVIASGALSQHDEKEEPYLASEQGGRVPTLTLFSAFADVPWRTIKLRKKKSNCASCGSTPVITFDSIRRNLHEHLYDGGSALQCGVAQVMLGPSQRIDPSEVQEFPGLIIDVRDETQYGIAHLPESLNVPVDRIADFELPECTTRVLMVCRQGVDSQHAAAHLAKRYPDVDIKDLRGGLLSYAEHDVRFPVY